MHQLVSFKSENFVCIYVPCIRAMTFIRKTRIAAAVVVILSHVGNVVEMSVKHFEYALQITLLNG